MRGEDFFELGADVAVEQRPRRQPVCFVAAYCRACADVAPESDDVAVPVRKCETISVTESYAMSAFDI